VNELGVDKEAKDTDGRTALHYAASNRHDTTVQLFIELGVDKQAMYYDRQMALRHVASKGHNSTVQLLVELGTENEVETIDCATKDNPVHPPEIEGRH
jgi:ankyrin repeat protein